MMFRIDSRQWRPFWKWRPLEFFQCRESIQDIIIYPHMKCRWNWIMLNLCGIVAAINGRHNTAHIQRPISTRFHMWVDYDVPNWFPTLKNWHHNLPTYEMSLKSDNVEFVLYCGGHFENGERQKIFNVGNLFRTSQSTHIWNVVEIG
jgi:hypothetical protein